MWAWGRWRWKHAPQLRASATASSGPGEEAQSPPRGGPCRRQAGPRRSVPRVQVQEAVEAAASAAEWRAEPAPPPALSAQPGEPRPRPRVPQGGCGSVPDPENCWAGVTDCAFPDGRRLHTYRRARRVSEVPGSAEGGPDAPRALPALKSCGLRLFFQSQASVSFPANSQAAHCPLSKLVNTPRLADKTD